VNFCEQDEESSGKPLISILMAVYEPRLDWLEEQLRSLNEQTYLNLRLSIRDDCSLVVPFEEIASCVRKCITTFPYTLKRNTENLGSNLTFQRLTEEAHGDYFAYCDQDDVWLPEKLSVLQEAIEKGNTLLVCSDMYIIDGKGKVVADSITKIRRRHCFHSGEELAESLLISNFVTGCTMLVRSEMAKVAVPFCPYMVHDHYIALYCAAVGAIVSLPFPLIRYRIHGGNQSRVLAGVEDKASYEKVRIARTLKRFQWLECHFPFRNSLQAEIGRRRDWVQARLDNWQGRGGKMIMWKYRSCDFPTTLFELMAPWLPEKLFMSIIRCASGM